MPTSSKYADTEIRKREIINLFLQNHHSFNYNKQLCDKIATDIVKKSLGIVSTLRFDFEKRYKKYRGHKNKFLEDPGNENWLDSYFRLPAQFILSSVIAKNVKAIAPMPEASTTSQSRKQKPFTELAESSKRRKLALLSTQLNGQTTKEIVLAASRSVKGLKEHDLSTLLKTVSSPQKATQILEKIKQLDLRAYTAEEALNFFLEKRLTWDNYKSIRVESKERGADIYPSYNMIKSARDKIRPKENTMQITNFTAVVQTQSLLDNTAQRLLKLQEDVITTLMTSKNCQLLNISLICSWGCDGSSSQSIYNQKSTNDDRQDFDETHMFATTLTPLRMTAFVGKSKKEFIIWNNSLPQSYRSCRPVNLMYKKETKELTLNEISRVRKDIESLSPYEESLGDGRKLIVTFSMHLTVIDGKVLAALTGVPCISCPLCEAKPNDFNEKENVGAQKFQPNPLSLRHGASPLHARIRFMELLFNVAIRMEVKVWRVCDDVDKVKVSERKKVLQEALQQTLHLRIDYLNPGGPGNSNNGNTARRFFEKYQETSKILGLNEDLIFRFRNILIALNCQMPLKADVFGRYCVETNNKFIDLYGWYKIPSSVHKILIHSEEIIISSILPLGMLGEEGAESRNKYYRSDRVHHARKNSRENNLRDIFVRALETSDPLISSFSTCARRKLKNSTPFPAEVVFFLQAPSSTPLSSPDSSQSSAISFSSDGLEDDSSVSLENEDLDCLVRRQEDMVTLIAEDLENVC